MIARFLNTRPIGGSVRGQMAIATAGLGAAWVAGYLFVIYRQGTELNTPMTVFLATFVGVMTALALGAAVIRDRSEGWAQAMLYAAAGGFLPAGVLGLASIGLPLILVGLLALVSAGPRRIPLRFGVAAGALSAIAFVIGVALTIRVS
jgi:hypothetical protein